MKKLLVTLLLFTSILNAKIGLEIGYLTFNVSTLIIDRSEYKTTTITNKGMGIDYSLFLKTNNAISNVNLKIGTIIFTEEPIQDDWNSIHSDSITHIEVGYNYKFFAKN